jgi:hypothetical protein
VDLLVRWPDWGAEEDAAWQVLAQLAGAVLDADKKRWVQSSLDDHILRGYRPLTPEEGRGLFPFHDFLRYKKLARVRLLSAPEKELVLKPHRGGIAARGASLRAEEDLGHSLIASAGGFRAPGFSRGAIFANGLVQVETLRSAIVVCDGEVEVKKSMGQCIVVARGAVKCPQEDFAGCILVSASSIQAPKGAARGNEIRENEQEQLGLIRFFELTQAGVEVEADKGGVRVKRVEDGKPFARAGLKPGDVVLALGGTAADSPEEFRRLVRRKLAEGADAFLKLRRTGKVLEIAVPLKD